MYNIYIYIYIYILYIYIYIYIYNIYTIYIHTHIYTAYCNQKNSLQLDNLATIFHGINLSNTNPTHSFNIYCFQFSQFIWCCISLVCSQVSFLFYSKPSTLKLSHLDLSPRSLLFSSIRSFFCHSSLILLSCWKLRNFTLS